MRISFASWRHDERRLVPAPPPGIVPPAPAWAVDRITQLTRLLAAEQSATQALRKQLAQRPASAGPKAGLRGMFRLAACEADRHLIDAITADRAVLERVNDRLRAENQQLRVKAEN